jgi:capsular exopolysaccharide synthesis family protein
MRDSRTEQTQQAAEKEFSIDELLQVLRRRRRGIAAIIVFAVVGAIAIYNAQLPEYHAVGVMLVSKDHASGDLVDAVLGTEGASDAKAAKKDAELLKSMYIAELTVNELWQSGRRDSLEFFGNRPYVSPVKRLFSSINPFDGSAKARNRLVSGPSMLSDELVRSYAIELNRRIRVAPVRETTLLNVSVASPFNDEAVFLTNMLCNVYKKADIHRTSEKYLQSNRFLAEMLEEQQQKLRDADAALSAFMTASGIYEVTGNSDELLQKMIEVDARHNDLLVEYRIVKNSQEFLEKKLSQSDRDLSSRIARNVNAQLGSIQDEIRARESEYVNVLKTRRAEDAEARAKKQELDMVRTRYEQLSRSKIAGQIGYAGREQKFSVDLIAEKLQTDRKLNQLDFSAREYDRLKNYYESKLSGLPEKQQKYLKLQRDRDVVSKTYLLLKEKVDETRILIGSEVGDVSIMGSAFMPFKPEKPNLTKTMSMGLVLGVVFAALYAFGSEYIDETVRDELFFKTVGFNVLGVVPFVSLDAGTGTKFFNRVEPVRNFFQKKGIHAKKNEFFVSSQESERFTPLITDKLNSNFAESFRTLRTNIGFSRVDNPIRTLVVSGASMGEGKSNICANVAIAMAIKGNRTLLIDCDLRRPTQHLVFKGKRLPGLTDYLVSQEEGVGERYFQKTHQHNLTLFSAGTVVPNPNELLASVKMQELIKKLSGQFDKIVLDTPPLFLSDAAQLALSVDAILLAARLRLSNKNLLRDYATNCFFRSRIIGIALIDSENNDNLKNGYGRYGYGRTGYGTTPYGNGDDEAGKPGAL